MEGSSVKKIPKGRSFVYEYEQHLYQRVRHSTMHAQPLQKQDDSDDQSDPADK